VTSLQDLIRELKSELSGHFEQVVLALLMTPAEYDAHELRKSVKVRISMLSWTTHHFCALIRAVQM